MGLLKMPMAVEYMEQILLNEPCINSDIRKKMKATYSHICKISQYLISIGFLESEKNGRRVMISLTKSGRDYTQYLMKANKMVPND